MPLMTSKLNKTLIIMPIWGAWEWAELCLRTIGENTIKEHYDILIVHNHNEAEDAELCEKYGADSAALAVAAMLKRAIPIDDVQVHYMPHPVNQGVSKSWNHGLRYGLGYKECHYDSFVMMNSDVVVFDQWLAHMRMVMFNQSSAPCPCVQPCLTEGGTPDHREILERCKGSPNAAQHSVGICGPCFMLSRSCVENVGLFDERFEYAFYEDSDYLMRLRMYGRDPVTSIRSYCHHHHAKSRSTLPFFEKYAELNKRRFEKKWSVRIPSALDAKSFPLLEDLRRQHGTMA